MNILMNIIFDVLGVSLGVVFFFMTLRGVRSLLGSFFKSYYRLLMYAAIALTFGFVIEPLGNAMAVDIELVELMHHVALILASGLFVYSSYILPRDARQYLELKGNPTV